MICWFYLLTPLSPLSTFYVRVDSSVLKQPALHNRSQIVLTTIGQSHGWPLWQMAHLAVWKMTSTCSQDIHPSSTSAYTHSGSQRAGVYPRIQWARGREHIKDSQWQTDKTYSDWALDSLLTMKTKLCSVTKQILQLFIFKLCLFI